MFIIECPYCGPRDQSEFSYGGQAHISRPTNSEALSDQEWAEFVFIRDNPKGLFAERWNHAAGCRKFFNCLRDTATDKIYAIYKMGETPPQIDAPELKTPSGEPAFGSGNDGTKVAVDQTAGKESA
ncbi:sarcosine oxidase subunit delta [Dichotomicrobium thermohalophilum]|uniref:Sarcosine oxidase subunit delta n=1 Tax=Dichotomicrobium thermohalophilum TaxID=933063 RepID=A0A397Q5N6_9HYPH|nr:sarcosine oxidase subunit delta [Dichotomicrobium thermohalophilum]RIA56263.1 sarcosine oxidase subunit delta [Dichotomicrobium thermohalophilum]